MSTSVPPSLPVPFSRYGSSWKTQVGFGHDETPRVDAQRCFFLTFSFGEQVLDLFFVRFHFQDNPTISSHSFFSFSRKTRIFHSFPLSSRCWHHSFQPRFVSYSLSL